MHLVEFSLNFPPQLTYPQAMKFLYHKGFPAPLGHVQSGNIFVINEVCKLGGYESTLLGYKTRLYKLCKDHMDHFDTILFGELVVSTSLIHKEHNSKMQLY